MIQEENNYLLSDSGDVYLLVGVLLANALFFLTIYVGMNKNRSYLLFSSYSLLGALGLFFLMDDLMLPFLVVFTLSCLSLLYFFLDFFNHLQSKRVAFLPPVLVLLPVVGLAFLGGEREITNLIIAWVTYTITLMICSLISLHAYNHRQYGGKLLFFTTALIFLCSLVFISESFFVSSLLLASVLLILAVTYTVLQDIQQRNEQLRYLKIKSMQLETELLKKSIQPHFLINTLTVLTEWIEEQPSLALRQIDLLSKEFRYITRVADQKLISLREELEICNVHLDMYNAKRSADFKLETKSITPDTKIPPMIFHTLVENGLTHSEFDEGRFSIEQEETESETTFRVSVEPLANQTAGDDGLGLSYIKSRLQQAFPDRWSLISGPKNNTWETLIRISR